jgi:hypothetical protein
MNYINELVYASQLAKAKKLTKDKKQKNKYHQVILLDHEQITDESTHENTDENIDSDTNENFEVIVAVTNERRAGKDRRQSQQERGRYVESRLNKSRRYRKKLSLIV